MTDTPKHVRELQRKIWLSKTPGERLLQTLKDNEALFLAWKEVKERREKARNDAQQPDASGRHALGEQQQPDHICYRPRKI